jgi:hypothetical protein
MSWNPVDWWEDATKDVLSIPGDITNIVGGWFSSAAGDIGSGLEAAFVAVFGDLWDVIAGPLEVLTGAIIIIITVSWMMKNQILTVALARM